MVAQEYRDNLLGISHFQGNIEKIDENKKAFRDAINKDKRITKADLARYIADNSFVWDLHEKVSNERWAASYD